MTKQKKRIRVERKLYILLCKINTKHKRKRKTTKHYDYPLFCEKSNQGR